MTAICHPMTVEHGYGGTRTLSLARRFYRAIIDARERSARRKVAAYLHGLDDARLEHFGIKRSEIDERFGSD